jgi:hypothetical protein
MFDHKLMILGKLVGNCYLSLSTLYRYGYISEFLLSDVLIMFTVVFHSVLLIGIVPWF